MYLRFGIIAFLLTFATTESHAQSVHKYRANRSSTCYDYTVDFPFQEVEESNAIITATQNFDRFNYYSGRIQLKFDVYNIRETVHEEDSKIVVYETVDDRGKKVDILLQIFNDFNVVTIVFTHPDKSGIMFFCEEIF